MADIERLRTAAALAEVRGSLLTMTPAECRELADLLDKLRSDLIDQGSRLDSAVKERDSEEAQRIAAFEAFNEMQKKAWTLKAERDGVDARCRTLESRLDRYEKMAAKLEPECFDDYAAYTAKVAEERDAALRRLDTLTTALQKIVDGRFLGYVEAQEIAREALSGPAPSAPSEGEKP